MIIVVDLESGAIAKLKFTGVTSFYLFEEGF